MKYSEGHWSGISIDLWGRRIADHKIPFRFAEEEAVQSLLEGTVTRKFDIAVAALTITHRQTFLYFRSRFFRGRTSGLPLK